MTNRYSGADKQAVHNTCMTASVCPRTPHYIQHSLPEEPRLRQLSPHPSCGKSKESIPTGLKGLGLLQLITTTTISHLAFTLTTKRRIDLFRSWSCAETSSRRSFCLIVLLALLRGFLQLPGSISSTAPRHLRPQSLSLELISTTLI